MTAQRRTPPPWTVRQRLSALWTLTRPRGAVWVPLLPALGYAFAHWDRALPQRDVGGILGLAAVWLLLSAGTLWLNAALDRDEGEVLFGEFTPVPPNIEWAAYPTLAAAVGLAAGIDWRSGLCTLGCAVLAVCYSHPRLAWKGHPVAGPAVNVIGYGVLSPLAGWFLVGVSPNPRSFAALLLIAVWVAGWYFAAQAFQEAEDRHRGYRTLVATHGAVTALRAARCMMGLGLAGTICLALIGWFPPVSLLAAPFFLAADVWLVRWIHSGEHDDALWAVGLVRRLMVAGAMLVLVVSAEYVRESLADEPVAGLGTPSGHPTDRPRVPPSVMRWMEHRGLVQR